MSRFETRHVQARWPDGAEVEITCLWVPRSGRKVLAIWRANSAPLGSRVLSEGIAYVVSSIAPVDERTEAATLAEGIAPT